MQSQEHPRKNCMERHEQEIARQSTLLPPV
jgi:hypothetical protein